MKKMEIEELADEIENIYINYDEYQEMVDKMSYKNISNVYIIDSEGEISYSSQNSRAWQVPTRNIIFDTSEIIQKVQQSTNKKIKYTYKIDKLKSEIFIYAKQMQDGKVLVLAASIDPIDSTTSVLKNQLIYVTIIALIFSAIISIFISKRISKPIRNIKNNAEKLAKGNYDLKFEKSGYYEIDELADTLNFAADELSKTDKVRRELIANVSHDLKTPLTMIKAYSEMIRDLSGDNKKKREEHLKVIIDETDRLTNLVNDMMDLSKIESGKVELDIKNICYTDLVNSITERIKNITEYKYTISVDVPDNIYVMADKTKIEQVLYNLITNAIKHAGEEKDIFVKVSVADKKVKTEVIDNGTGIAKEDLPHIFDRYYKSDKSYKRSSEGSGLGLSIVKNILIAHNANYGVESKINEGSNFWFELSKSTKPKRS